MKKYIFGLLTGIVLTVSIVVIADTINSNEVLYDNTLSTSSVTNVKGAIDDLYDKIVHSNGAYNLIGHIDDTLSTELLGGLHRYQGTNVNNYLCFGTSDKDTCVSNKSNYMYRIIGYKMNGQMKLIKATTIGVKKWESSGGNISWADSSLFVGLNDSYFLNNSTYVPDNSWSNRIATTTWHYGDITSTGDNVDNLANAELNLSGSVSAKISIMYLHDYYYGMKSGSGCPSDTSICKNGWIHLSNNGYNGDEWTSARYSGNFPWAIKSSGFTWAIGMGNYAYNEYYVRPVFFLNSTETIASGSGTIDDPYILN